MQHKIYTLLPLFYLNCILGQNKQPDTLFDTDYFNAVNHWVVLPQNLPPTQYLLGYVYADPHQGFIFIFEDELTLNTRQIWKRRHRDNTCIFRLLLDTKSPKLYLPDAKVLQKLKVDGSPIWLEAMTYDAKTWIESSRKFMARAQYAEAVFGFEQASKQNAQLVNLNFELALALNSAERYPECINHLIKSIAQKPSDYRLYREMGYALVQMHQPQEAEKVYEQGLQMCVQTEQKREMALDMTQTFYRLRDPERFEKWAKILRQF